MRYAVTYDIPDDRRRKKVSDALEGYGYRVNYSVFELDITTTQLKHLKHDLYNSIDPKQDSVRFYHIAQIALSKSFELGDCDGIFEPKTMFL